MVFRNLLRFSGMVLLFGASLLGSPLARATDAADCQFTFHLTRLCTPQEMAEYQRLLRAKHEQTERESEAIKAAGGFGSIPTPAEDAQWDQWQKDHAQIKLSSNGQTFTVAQDSMINAYLDDKTYPLSDLSIICRPFKTAGFDFVCGTCSSRYYPVRIVTREVGGTCILKEKDFSVRIVVPGPTHGTPGTDEDEHQDEDHHNDEDQHHDHTDHDADDQHPVRDQHSYVPVEPPAPAGLKQDH